MIEGQKATALKSRPAAPSRLTGPEWVLLLVLAGVQFTHIMDFVIMMPLGPQFQTALRINTHEFGQLVSAYGFSACLSGLLAARFLDRFDRKKSLLVLYGGFTVGTLLCAVAPGYWPLMMARAVAGAFAGVMAANVLAIIGDAFPDSRRGRATGVVMSAFSLASIAGVPAGLALANQFGWRTPFAVLGVLSAGVLGLAWFVLPPQRRHLASGTGEATGTWAVLTNPTHVRAYVLMLALVLSTFTILPYLAIYLVRNAGQAETDLPWVYFCGGGSTLLTLTLFGWLSDRFGKLLVFRALALLAIVPALMLTHLPVVPLAVALLTTTLFMVLTSGRMVPAMAMITASSLPRYRGSFLSINSSVQQMGLGLAPLLGGAILGEGESGTPLTGFGSVGILAAATMLLTVYLAGRLRSAEARPLLPRFAARNYERDADTSPALADASG
jgi:predicted MFS family arabinose efflux permease